MKEKIQRVQSALPAGTAALVTSGANRFYLTGFPSSAGSVLIFPDGAVFLIDFRYYEKAKATVTGCEVLLCTDRNAQIAEQCRAHGATRLYLETQSVSMDGLRRLRQSLTDLRISGSGKIDRLLEEMRAVKTAREADCIRIAQQWTDETFDYILNRIAAGRTERDVMLDMEFYMRKLGSSGVSFDFIVVSGKNSSLPHGVPTDKKIEKGDFVTMDFGAVCDGYRSDMTRTVAVGTVSEEQKQVYEAVLRAQEAAFRLIRPGAVCREVDGAARELIENAGYKDCFGHGLGHSVGIEIHESPSFNTRCETKLKSGTVITVEPGIYLENRFGVRIEDMVLVTNDGYENLTASPKNLIII